jgi:tetratricopeptide (TPR) repeat protein
MSAPILSLGLLTVSCFSLATWVGPRFDASSGRRGEGVLNNMLGDSRKLFADHFFTRSDIYFHSGYYPGIFDQKKMKENHLASGAKGEKCDHDHNHEGPCEHDHGHVAAKKEPTADQHDKHDEAEHVHGEHCNHGEDGTDFLGKPKDYFDAFSRNFFVSKHTHLTDKGTNAAREILPWLKLSAQLDPSKVESYTVGAFWLRDLKKHDEAEQFLREGLRQNPESYEIMLELGRGYFEKRDYVRARHVLEMAIRRWREQENPKPVEKQNRFSAEQILNYLAWVEDRSGNREQAIRWLEIVRKVSPHPEEIDKRIAEVRAGKPLEAL